MPPDDEAANAACEIEDALDVSAAPTARSDSDASPRIASAEAKVPPWILRGLARPSTLRSDQRRANALPLSTEEAALRETRIAGFELLDVLGSGSWAVVFRARNSKLGRVVALKVLRARGPETERALLSEAKLASLEHENIARLYSVSEELGFLEMELIVGCTLRELLQGTALELVDVVQIGRQIAAGLAAAHQRSIVHRDLSHNNVMVADDGRVKILDFGLAKMLEGTPGTDALPAGPSLATSRRALGTEGFRSPEQVAGKPLDERSDVFALGRVLERMVKRSAPETSALETKAALSAIIARCLAVSPEDRFADAGEVNAALAAAMRAAAPISGEASAPASSPLGETPPSERLSGRRLPARGWKALQGISLLALGTAAVTAVVRVSGVEGERRPGSHEAGTLAPVESLDASSRLLPAMLPVPPPSALNHAPIPLPTTRTEAATGSPASRLPPPPHSRRHPGELDPNNPY